ncbi:hypothetical protein HEK616_73130 [Streptomyces nigrescens]|uniref:Tetratricopeptide repeat protein n=1 Tax=Streptomyces nigrescens TaxID=1920 RepID=A0ABM8A564_STRNI|nr:tetratricopeptide repeat protein [Streptomyces nigrescens]BDM73826.1 hypothetical protein HEK616_73130 [Streptomyces nigrescens]
MSLTPTHEPLAAAMFNSRAESERSLTAPLPAPRYMAWWWWSGLGFAGLTVALWQAGDGRPAWKGDGLVGAVGQVFGGVGAVFKPTKPGGASIGSRLAFLLILLVLLYFLWRATRAWLAYKPGAVDVQQLEDATPLGTPKPSNVDLTARLRRRLSDSSMYPPATLPAQAPAESFLELLGDVEIDPDKLGTALPKLLGRLRPKLAYRVSGILQYRDGAPDPYGMTVTVTAFLFGGSRAKDVWGSDWDDVIRKAGSWTVSTLLPVTRAGRLPPWRRWWGQELKPELYEAYQEANTLSREGRHHEALEQYFTAVRLDPVNPYLRAELAETQEKMGLHIDALDTCQRALTLDGQSARGYRKRLWLSHWNPHPRRLRYFLHPRRYRELIGLRYRNSIILGTAETTARQWVAGAGTNGRQTCENLVPLLVDRYWPAALGLDGRRIPLRRKERKRRKDAGRNSLRQTLRSGNSAAIRLVMQRAAVQETARLASDDAWARVWLYWPARLWSWIRFCWPVSYYQSVRGTPSPVTRGAFHINRKVWAPLRLTWATSAYDATRKARKETHPYKWRWPYTWRLPVSRLSWEGLEIRSLRWRLRLAALLWTRRDWHTHYNAACVYAVAMYAHRWDRSTQRQLAARAIAHLAQAILATRGTAATVERSWLVEEDPDLALLRHKGTRPNTHFNNFVRTVYPSAEAFEQSPPSTRTDEQLREYDYRLLVEIAKVMQEVWNQRCDQGEADIQCATEWLRVERSMWKSVWEIADPGSRRRWQDRVSFIRYLQANCQPVATSALGFPPPLVPEEKAGQNGHPDSDGIEKTLTALQRDLEGRRGLARANGFLGRPFTNCQQGQQVLRAAATDGVTQLSAKRVQRLSTGYAAAWQTLDDWLEGEASHEAFRQALTDVPQLTRRRVTALREARTLRI